MYVTALGWVGAAEHAAVDACTPATLGIEVIHPPPSPSPITVLRTKVCAGRWALLCTTCLSQHTGAEHDAGDAQQSLHEVLQSRASDSASDSCIALEASWDWILTL